MIGSAVVEGWVGVGVGFGLDFGFRVLGVLHILLGWQYVIIVDLLY